MMDGQREQDEAADGPVRRELRLADGTIVMASVAARRYARTPNQCYGYLQFKAHGKTVTKYIGRVAAESRAESLRLLTRNDHMPSRISIAAYGVGHKGRMTIKVE